MNLFVENVVLGEYFVVEYFVESATNLADAAVAIAIGQSVGNPKERNKWETEKLFEDHSCLILGDEKVLSSRSDGLVKIAFPNRNMDWDGDGVSQLLCMIMGGQLDIDIVKKCRVVDLLISDSVTNGNFLGPKYGIKGAREFTGVHEKPLLGGIVKPKTGIGVNQLLDIVKEMVDGGVNFIKEDEIMSNPSVCPLKERVAVISKYLRNKSVIYCFCINSDPLHVLSRAKMVCDHGGTGIHVNFWSGMGVYKSLRDLDLPLFLHFQKSGDKILTNPSHDHSISWKVICKLAGWMGVDFIHAGMWGGYLNDGEESLKDTINLLNSMDVMPALSCGMHPGLINATTKRFGIDYMANVGGAIHGHPSGTKSGVRAMRQAIDGYYGTEYKEAIEKWGKVD
jgi:ribulose-bisphosphate carboxylase large chain